MSELTALPWDSVGTVGLALIVMAMVVTGRLVPRSMLDKLTTDLAQQNDYLRKHIDAQQAVKSELATQNTELLSTAKLATALLQAVAPRESHVAQDQE